MLNRKLRLIAFASLGLILSQSQAMSLEQSHYTISSNDGEVWIKIGNQMISGHLKRVTLCEPTVDMIQFIFPGNRLDSIDVSELPGDLLIRVMHFAPNSYTVTVTSKVTNEQIQHHFDF